MKIYFFRGNKQNAKQKFQVILKDNDFQVLLPTHC